MKTARCNTADLLALAPEATEGMHVINVPASGAGSDFEENYTTKYGEPQAGLAFAAHAYDGIGVLAEAIGSVGTDGPAIRDYLYGLTGYKGVVGEFSFDENGDVVGVPYVLKEVQNGTFVKLQDISVN